MLVMLARSGPPEAQNCPALLCDQCLEPIAGRQGGGEIGGLVIFRTGADGRQELATLHKGRCNRAYEAAHPGTHWSWQELTEFMRFLAMNTAEAFPLEDNVEYIAPAPSTWRLGEYRRDR
jgi:hypothetical protein